MQHALHQFDEAGGNDETLRRQHIGRPNRCCGGIVRGGGTSGGGRRYAEQRWKKKTGAARTKTGQCCIQFTAYVYVVRIDLICDAHRQARQQGILSAKREMKSNQIETG
jgi:hypothetical protein